MRETVFYGGCIRIRSLIEFVRMTREESISPERLMAAVDALCDLFSEVGGHAVEFPSRRMGTDSQPDALRGFTVHEVREAEHFLLRCGLVRGVKDRPETTGG